MKTNDLNDYILRYIEKDQSKYAIMLTGEWGSGKSYYIQNELIPFLQSNKRKPYYCITVSLYGLSDVFALSKSVYIESVLLGIRRSAISRRLNKILPLKIRSFGKSVAAVGSGICKTVVKGVAGKYGLELSISDRALKKLFKSADLSGKLLIFEDLERTSIDLLDLLGYVNGLVEQDGVKVLLVANEEELIKLEQINYDNPQEKHTIELLERLGIDTGREETSESKNYLTTKEKTVSDTIVFEGDYISACRNIINGYKSKLFSILSSRKSLSEMQQIMEAHSCFNLRTFIFACQKSYEIIEQLPDEQKSDHDFVKTIFYSIVAFSIRLKSGQAYSWEERTDASADLGTEKYPLFRFCYNYITQHSFETKQIVAASSYLKEIRLYDEYRSINDENLRVLYNWSTYEEQALRTAIENICQRLQKSENAYAFQEYGRIAYYLIKTSRLLGCDISQAKEALVKNLYNRKSHLREEHIFRFILPENEDNDVITDFKLLKEQMTNALRASDLPPFEFSYSPSDIASFADNVRDNEGQILRDGAFSCRLDLDKTIEMITQCSALQIYELRGLFTSLYRTSNIRDFLQKDRIFIESLRDALHGLCDHEAFDKIQKYQLGLLVLNLEDIAKRLKV